MSPPVLNLLVLLALLSPGCRATVQVAPHPTSLGQHKLTIRYPPGCTRPLLYVRIQTAGGGIIYPPIGYFRLSAGYPREIDYYVWPGAAVQQRDDQGHWHNLPISNKPRGWN